MSLPGYAHVIPAKGLLRQRSQQEFATKTHVSDMQLQSKNDGAFTTPIMLKNPASTGSN
jgi:hypothetical protein